MFSLKEQDKSSEIVIIFSLSLFLSFSLSLFLSPLSGGSIDEDGYQMYGSSAKYAQKFGVSPHLVVPYFDIAFTSLLSQNDTKSMYRGIYRGQPVLIKELKGELEGRGSEEGKGGEFAVLAFSFLVFILALVLILRFFLFSGGFSDEQEREFAREVLLTSRLNCRNITQMIGACFEKGRYCLLLEYMESGDLEKCLIKQKESCVDGLLVMVVVLVVVVVVLLLLSLFFCPNPPISQFSHSSFPSFLFPLPLFLQVVPSACTSPLTSLST